MIQKWPFLPLRSPSLGQKTKSAFWPPLTHLSGTFAHSTDYINSLVLWSGQEQGKSLSTAGQRNITQAVEETPCRGILRETARFSLRINSRLENTCGARRPGARFQLQRSQMLSLERRRWVCSLMRKEKWMRPFSHASLQPKAVLTSRAERA